MRKNHPEVNPGIIHHEIGLLELEIKSITQELLRLQVDLEDLRRQL